MTFDESWSSSLRKVTELERPDHWHLGDADECYFFGAYTPRAGYAHSATNQLISNLKKPVSVRGTFQWTHKLRAERELARSIRANIREEALGTIAVVPIPPSKTSHHPEYDERMLRVARLIGGVEVCECLITRADRAAAHLTDDKRDLDALRLNIECIEDNLPPQGKLIMLIDDVLTTGCSFVVCKSILSEHRPEATIFGVFAARCVWPSPFADFEDL